MRMNVAVVIPYYHSELSELEKISFHNCCTVLKEYPIILVIPEGMDRKDCPPGQGLLYERVPDSWLASVRSYNQMMLSEQFYSRFVQYKYILVFQLDAFVFSDCLRQFCDYGYDYIGAPWLAGIKYLRIQEKGVWYVGNGGFSLRNVSASLGVLRAQTERETVEHEDVFWASCDSEQFRVAPVDVALTFSFEQDVRRCFSLNNNQFPFGCHAWEKYDFGFWRPVFEKMGYFVKTLIPMGIDERSDNSRPDIYYLEAEKKIIKACLLEFCNGRQKKIYIFGTGIVGKECNWLLQRADMKAAGWIDNNEMLWGKEADNLSVISPDILKSEKAAVLIFIAANRGKKEILTQLEEMGYSYGQEIFFYSDLTERICSEQKRK